MRHLRLLVIALLLLPLGAARAQVMPSAAQTPPQFAQKLRADVASALGSGQALQTHAVHWMLLVDTSQYQATAPVAVADFKVLEALFPQTIRQGDFVSVVPFQLHPTLPTVWEKQVSRYDDLRPELPAATQQEGHQGGRDIEAAVKYALGRTSAEGQGNKAVLLVLSASRFSEVPTGEPHYLLTTDHDPALTHLISTLGCAPTISLVSVPTAQKGGDKDINLYVRAYVPHPLAASGSLSSVNTGTAAKPVSGNVGSSATTAGVIGAAHGSPLLRWLLIALAVLALLALAWYLYKKPPPPPTLPLLVMENGNRRFPAFGQVEVYGHSLATATPGTAQEPARVSLDNPDLPPAAQGHLFTLQDDKRRGVTITPHLYTADPATVPYDTETVLRLKPVEGIDGFPVQTTFTVRR